MSLGDGEGDDWANAGKLLEIDALSSGGDRELVDIADEEDEDPAGLVKREDASEDSLESALEEEQDDEVALERLDIRGVSQRLFALPELRRRKLPPL